jgi:hypothetical protein
MIWPIRPSWICCGGRSWNPTACSRPGRGKRSRRTAATLLGGLAQSLRQRGHDPQPVAHFMTRLLFCLFAEDIGLLPDRLFSTLVEESRRTPADFPGLASGDVSGDASGRAVRVGADRLVQRRAVR